MQMPQLPPPADEVYRMWYYANSQASNDNADYPKGLSMGKILLAGMIVHTNSTSLFAHHLDSSAPLS